MISRDAYVPWRSSDPDLRGDEFVSHPSDIYEPTNLAATEGPPLSYALQANMSGLSTMQRETVRAIMTSLATRGAFLLGDATGVGKGRTLAGLAVEYMFAVGGAVLWVSANSRLERGVCEELATVGAKADAVVFQTYTSLNNPTKASHTQSLLNNSSASPLVILDECHMLRNQNGIAHRGIEDLLAALQAPRVVYSSATPFSQARHLHYLGRLGLFGSSESPFESYLTLRNELCAHGSAYMELLAMDMKARGAYMARQLSFNHIEMTHSVCALDSNARRTYDQCVSAVQAVGRTGSSQQRFFQKLITSLKVSAAIRITEAEIAAGHSVVITLINTGEAAARRRRTDATENHGGGDPDPCTRLPSFDDLEDGMVDHLADVDIPPNPIDAVLAHFGTERVAELSGRSTRPVRQSDGRFATNRVPNLSVEADEFVSGRKCIAIVTRAGGTGISLHDKKDGRRRVHIILELPWSPEELLQQMGRTHRSDSICAPRYILLITDVPSELRFASSIVQKLQTFGALVKGDRTSCNFGYIRVPQWTLAEKRSLGLCFAAAVLDTKPTGPSPTRRAAQLACGVSSRSNDVAAKNTVINALTLCDEASRAGVLAGALRLYPQDLFPLFWSWSPERHRMFPRPFQDQTLALLLSSKAWETRQTVGLLSKDTLYLIIEHLASAVDAPRVAMVSKALCDVGMQTVVNAPTHQVLNHLLCTRLEIQDSFFALADMQTQSTAREKASVKLVEEFASNRAGPCISAEVETVTHRNFSVGAGVVVTLRFLTMAPPSPPPDARFFRHAQGFQSAWMHDSMVVFDDGRTVRVNDELVLSEREFVLSTRRQWEGAVHHRQTTAARRIKKQSRHFYLATRETLASWPHSQKRVLRLRASPQFPHGLVGLLMHTD